LLGSFAIHSTAQLSPFIRVIIVVDVVVVAVVVVDIVSVAVVLIVVV
jgi:hypothetical protein